jgi:hypothetical protein
MDHQLYDLNRPTRPRRRVVSYLLVSVDLPFDHAILQLVLSPVHEYRLPKRVPPVLVIARLDLLTPDYT